jgi:hypothetical protein
MEADMNPKIIVIDGKTYHSVDEMPPDVRQKYEKAMRSLGDANENRIPEAFESMNIFADKDRDNIPDVLENIAAGHVAVNSMKIVIDGKEFSGIENLPPEARARYEEAMGKLDANRNGIPDFVEGMAGTSNQPVNVSASFGVGTSRRSASNSRENPVPVSATITPDTSNGWMLVLAGVVILLLCVASAAGVWYFFLR